MKRSSHAQRVLALLHKQGFLSTSDLDTIGAPRVVLTRLSTSWQLERVGRGLYRLPGNSRLLGEPICAFGSRRRCQ
ncbi:type IV toxin-antitoxin system AbiEi family antitoxin domain-containing protein [Pseudomonas sp. NY15372]|uniref:type IV toxin-antitoxin system AbiEi family antitoxin domain-containing protein n=1 Tax=Pseudomonas sp. NY15372 TaxID=3400356 RepID=UPI003A88BC04